MHATSTVAVGFRPGSRWRRQSAWQASNAPTRRNSLLPLWMFEMLSIDFDFLVNYRRCSVSREVMPMSSTSPKSMGSLWSVTPGSGRPVPASRWGLAGVSSLRKTCLALEPPRVARSTPRRFCRIPDRTNFYRIALVILFTSTISALLVRIRRKSTKLCTRFSHRSRVSACSRTMS